MVFEWDKRKKQINLKKHGLDFADAHKVFEQPMLVNLDDREDYGEERWVGIGLADTRVVVIVFAEPGEDTIRVISFRKATNYERQKYGQAYANRLGTN